MYSDRKFKVPTARFTKWTLLNVNPCARRNQQYHFSCSNNKDIKAAESGIFANINSTFGNNLNAKDFIQKLNSNDKELEINLVRTMSAVRNSKEYWHIVSSDLRAFNRHKGPAHIFGTLSPAEYNWVDLKDFILKHASDVSNIKEISLCELINLEPLLVSFYFEQKFNSFFTKVLLNHKGPLGKVVGYFWRREYQCRGAPHIHYKLWIEGAPVYGVDSEDKVIELIDSHITCRLPDPILEPRLYELVIKYQRHKCTGSCRRKVFRHRKFYEFCRYSFPRFPSKYRYSIYR